MNLVATLGIYASVLRERGEPLHYPGTGSPMVEATDTTLIAQCAEWALHAPEARNQHFNLTNGEFFSLRAEWPALASYFGMQPGEMDKPIRFQEEMPSMAKEWDVIRTKYGLKAPKLGEFLGQSAQFSDFIFQRQEGAPCAMSCVKVRRAGFWGTVYTDEMFGKWVRRYREEGLVPPL
jgi:nucleoside-diphosphate-sugar epimerase